MPGVMVPWLVDAARLTGHPVAEVAGWRSRGHGGMAAVEGVVCHHTGGPPVGEAPSLGVVRDGRADLPGPLSHYVLGRSGTVYVVAAGTCWHAGASRWGGLEGLNSRCLGIEAESAGDGVWTPAQLDCYPRLVAACLHYMRRDESRVCGHRECAMPAGRKPDPTGIDMAILRAWVARMLTDPLRLIPTGSVLPGMPPQRSSEPRPTLRPGASGLAVREMQTLLGVVADGEFGPRTAHALLAFQLARHLVPDAVCGPATWPVLAAAPASTG